MPDFFEDPPTVPEAAHLLPSVLREAQRRRRRRALLTAAAVMGVLAASGTALGMTTSKSHGVDQTLLTSRSPSMPTTGAASPTASLTQPATAQSDLAVLHDTDWPRAVDPIMCGFPIRVVQIAYAVEDNRGRAVLLLRCDSGASNWPDGLFVYGVKGQHIQLQQTLIRPAGDRNAPNYVVDATFDLTGTTLVVTGRGYSSTAVPQCCADQTRTYTWQWVGPGFKQV